MSADPIITAVAVAVAGKVVEGVADGGKAALRALVRLVRQRLRSSASAEEALVEAEADPSDQHKIQLLQEQLHTIAAEDKAFAMEIRRLWREIDSGSDAAVVNSVSGEIGNVVQARDIYGGISFGGSGEHRG